MDSRTTRVDRSEDTRWLAHLSQLSREELGARVRRGPGDGAMRRFDEPRA